MAGHRTGIYRNENQNKTKQLYTNITSEWILGFSKRRIIINKILFLFKKGRV
jgi:hypothetical protein